MRLHIGLKDDATEKTERKLQTNINQAGDVALQHKEKKEKRKAYVFSSPQVNRVSNLVFCCMSTSIILPMSYFILFGLFDCIVGAH